MPTRSGGISGSGSSGLPSLALRRALTPNLLGNWAVDGGRGVEVHAEGRLGQRRACDRLGRCQVRAGEPELHAGGQRRVEALVVVLGDGGGGFVDLREHGRHPLGRRRRRGQEANCGALLVERAVGDKAIKVDIQAEVAAKSLDRPDHAEPIQRLGAGGSRSPAAMARGAGVRLCGARLAGDLDDPEKRAKSTGCGLPRRPTRPLRTSFRARILALNCLFSAIAASSATTIGHLLRDPTNPGVAARLRGGRSVLSADIA